MSKFHEITIEYGRGETYANSDITVYGHGTYPRHSVLAGQNQRCWLNSFSGDEGGLKAAKEWIAENHPDIRVSDLTDTGGSTHISVDRMTAHLPDTPDW
ncbi:MAG: hypothetical protein JSV32_00410 [Dehalococcoidia bacterium]|jgi:hypothetical protein|nr:MAG: hypothetical protein JSV32_00410 [Dehalococcoidia bacterium]